ncbi:MAG: stage 0 sporulation family protein [Lachnospiraceae bacterium]|nr:stage 0 sporulation family protein [Lachnospiraceae bacterium]
MIRIVGIRFRNTGKLYNFAPGEFDLSVGDHVVVETSKGLDYGTVMTAPRDMDEALVIQPVKEILRIATPEDDDRVAENIEKEKEAYRICQEKIEHHGLEMKLVQAEYAFDRSKLLFYFTADGRIDFRELVKDLAAVFRTRIELRQIGVRDETKLIGGLGICGRELCCCTYLSDFVPVSIKMAKEQNLSLNPTKISGACGRLMCCLKNEQETYEYLNSRLPAVGDYVVTKDGYEGSIQAVNVLRQRVRILIDVEGEKEQRECELDEVFFNLEKRSSELTEEDKKALKQQAKNDAKPVVKRDKAEEPAPFAPVIKQYNFAAVTETKEEIIVEEKIEIKVEEKPAEEGRKNNGGKNNYHKKNFKPHHNNNKNGGENRENRENREPRENKEGKDAKPANKDGKHYNKKKFYYKKKSKPAGKNE